MKIHACVCTHLCSRRPTDQYNNYVIGIKMSRKEDKQAKKEDYFDKLKENYVLRIQELDSFCKRLSNSCTDVNKEFLYGSLNAIQHYIDLQKKYASKYSQWYNTSLMSKQSRLITETWIQILQNMDSFYIGSLDYTKNNLRTANKNITEFIMDVGKFYDIYDEILSNQNNRLETESLTSEIKVSTSDK